MSVEENVLVPHNTDIKLEQDTEKWTVVQVDSQVLSIFMSCPAKYNYVMNRRLIPIGGVSKSILRGSYVHDGNLTYWKYIIENGFNYEEAVKAALMTVKNKLAHDDKFSHEEKLDTLQGFLDFLKHIQSLSWIPIAAEKYFRIKAYEDPELKLRIYLTGRIDLILKSPQVALLPVDAKTESERWFHTQMSNQFKIYCIATKSNLLGVQRIGFQKGLEPKDKYKMELLPFDEDILEEFRTITLPHYVKQLILCHEDNFFPMNSTSCVHGHFACQFSDKYNGGICNVSRLVREQKIERYFKVGEEWDPETTMEDK